MNLRQVWLASGIPSVYGAGPDAWLIIAARSGRMVAYGASTLVLALFFAALDVSDERIGLFMTLTLAGDVALSLVLTFAADHLGRRRALLAGSVLMIVAGAVFATCENYWLLLLAAIVGVLSATGGDIGPFRAVEESMLSEITSPATRADVLAWYVTTSTLGSSIGTELAGRALHYLHDEGAEGAARRRAADGSGGSDGSDGSDGVSGQGWTLLQAYHACFWGYAAMGGVNLVLSLLLSQRTELRTAAGDAGKEEEVGGDEENGSAIPLQPQPRAQPLPSVHTDDDDDNDDDAGEDRGLMPASQRQDDAEASTSSSPTLTSPPTPPTGPPKSRLSQISHQTRSAMYGLWFLLMLDALADGMASMALTTYYLDTTFHVSKDSLGHVVSASYFLSAASSVLAGPLVRALGLVRTMVFTHVPSSTAVLLFPIADSVPLAYLLLLVRVALNNLDQAPRSALIAAVVRPHERTAVLGVTSLLRTVAAAAGPSLTGLLAGHGRFWIAFVVAGALRLAYDLGLFAFFVNIRLFQYEAVPEGQPGGGGGGVGAAAGAAIGAAVGAAAFVVGDDEGRRSDSSGDSSSGSTVHDGRASADWQDEEERFT